MSSLLPFICPHPTLPILLRKFKHYLSSISCLSEITIDRSNDMRISIVINFDLSRRQSADSLQESTTTEHLKFGERISSFTLLAKGVCSFPSLWWSLHLIGRLFILHLCVPILFICFVSLPALFLYLSLKWLQRHTFFYFHAFVA